MPTKERITGDSQIICGRTVRGDAIDQLKCFMANTTPLLQKPVLSLTKLSRSLICDYIKEGEL